MVKALRESLIASIRRLDAGERTYDVTLTGPKFWSRVLLETKSTLLCAVTFNPCGFRRRGSCNVKHYDRNPYVHGMHKVGDVVHVCMGCARLVMLCMCAWDVQGW